MWRHASPPSPSPALSPLPGGWDAIEALPQATQDAYQWAYHTGVICENPVVDPTAAVSRTDAGHWIRRTDASIDCGS